MPSIDMPLEQLRQYKPSLYREEDFESFWQGTINEALKQPLHAELVPFSLPTKNLECYAVRYEGFGGGRIAGWYMRPSQRGKFPGVCMYHGYSGRGARPMDMIALASQGICVLSMDCRGQNGQSQDTAVVPEGQHSGWMTKGIRDPKAYYYRYVYADAVRALELLAGREEVDPTRLAITGGSQGGALTLAVAALSDRPVLALPDIPFLCDFRRAVAITGNGPYPEIAAFIKSHPHIYEQAFRTLSYFDCMNLAPKIQCRTVICNCLWDDICPPSTIFAAYHHMTCPKSIEIYPYHKHEVPYEHGETKFRLIAEVLQP
ncbi:cephalosporin-C deacetylase [soil metagenome]